MFYTYVIYNKVNNKIYVGHTKNLKNRIARHNRILPIKKTSYTFKNKGEWKLVYNEAYKTRKEAIKREKELKSYQGRVFFIRQKILAP